MHEGETLYTLSLWDALILFAFVGIWLVLVLTRRSPSISSFREFVNLLNSRGGNILILMAATFYAFRAAMRLFYHVIGMISEGKLDEKSAVMMMALAFVTGTVFGQFSGALLKTMTGHESDSSAPPASPANGNGDAAAAVPTSAPTPGIPTMATAATPGAPAGWGAKS